MRKDKVIDETIIHEDFTITYRQRLTAYDDDDTVIGTRYEYKDLNPADDISGEPPFIRKITKVVWTPAIITAAVAARDAETQRRENP